MPGIVLQEVPYIIPLGNLPAYQDRSGQEIAAVPGRTALYRLLGNFLFVPNPVVIPAFAASITIP
jgi:hypothetical protein